MSTPQTFLRADFDLTPRAQAELEATVEDAFAEYSETLIDTWALEIEEAPLPLFGQISKDYGAGYRQCQQDMAALLRAKLDDPKEEN